MRLNSSFFNLLTFNKRVLKLAGSITRSESHLLCCDWLFAADVTHSCACAPLTQDQAWVDRESWWSASWYQQSRIGVVWFCQLKTNPVTLNLFIYHHGTGPRRHCANTYNKLGYKMTNYFHVFSPFLCTEITISPVLSQTHTQYRDALVETWTETCLISLSLSNNCVSLHINGSKILVHGCDSRPLKLLEKYCTPEVVKWPRRWSLNGTVFLHSQTIKIQVQFNESQTKIQKQGKNKAKTQGNLVHRNT